MKFLFMFLFVFLVACDDMSESRISVWNKIYDNEMKKFGYTLDSSRKIISKNDIQIYEDNGDCRGCYDKLLIPHSLYDEMRKDFSKSLRLSTSNYEKELMKKLNLEEVNFTK